MMFNNNKPIDLFTSRAGSQKYQRLGRMEHSQQAAVERVPTQDHLWHLANRKERLLLIATKLVTIQLVIQIRPVNQTKEGIRIQPRMGLVLMVSEGLRNHKSIQIQEPARPIQLRKSVFQKMFQKMFQKR